jgi:DNA modification methylase
MSQNFKNIYFADFPADSCRKKNITLAFGHHDTDLFESIRPLSSMEVRELLGHSSYLSLRVAANREGININPYCVRILRKRFADAKGPQPLLPLLAPVTRPLIDPIQATFKGGQKEPLHNWYPYLEGYSPKFVEQIIQEFAPQASVVLDPFAGTGTTALTVARMGRQALYCELNPLLQYLIETKVTALVLDEKRRLELAQRLDELTATLPKELLETSPDIELQLAYSRTFSPSTFFDPVTFDQVLRARTYIDEVSCGEPFVATLITIALLSVIVDVSLLIRRGDLRFRNEKEAARKSSLVEALTSRLLEISNDLRRIETIDHRPALVCENANRLSNLPDLGVDAIITSPPYLNGTNYFRNTKLELWFLRCLRDQVDLAEFRRKAVTAGINDVTVDKTRACDSPEVREVVNALAASPYDSRIPRMVDGYFSDMQAMFRGLRRHLKRNARVVIDIGDSAYNGVHVPTDGLLKTILNSEGYSLEREVELRKRTSRGGLPLRQVLLVFRANQSPASRRENQPKPTWQKSWNKFKNNLPHQQEGFVKRNWGHALHSLCSYQGKMKPALAHHLVKTFVPPSGTILDPFAGVGTIPFEAALQGMKASAFEISPAALQIAAAKLGRPQSDECEVVLDSLSRFIAEETVTEAEAASIEAIRFNGKIREYFHEKTLAELLLARRFFKSNPPQTASESLVLSSLLHILHGNRPYALSRNSHPITPFAPSGAYEYRSLLQSLRNKVERSLALEYPAEFVSGKTYHQDATGWWPQELDNLDAIITSPPFFDSTRFYLANWMRLWFCGWEASDFKRQPLAFIDERQKRSLDVYEPIFRQARERLKATGVLVLHLGKSKKCDMAHELKQIGSRWFRRADLFTESVEHCESHGIRDKGTVVAHQYLVMHR